MSRRQPEFGNASWQWRLAAALLVSFLPVFVGLRTPLEAVPAGITFSSITPIAGGDLQIARTAANNPLDPPTFQLKADIFLNNTTSTNRSVTSVTISYPGSALTPFTYTPLTFPANLPPAPFLIIAGDVSRVPVYDGLDRDLPLPLPASVRIEVYIDFDPTPLELNYGLAIRENPVPNGAYFFPGKASDLAAGQYWAFGTRHVVDSGGGGGTLNPSGGTQRYALDMDVVQWNGSAWSSIKPSTTGDTNDDYWGFGLPMYAMANGIIVRCYRGEADHQPGGFDEITFEFNFGNSIFIDHGGDISIYAHMKDGSIPNDLCPADGDNTGLNIPIAAGEFIGQMGNTGRSTNTHLHLQVEGLPSSDPISGAPINFLNIRALADDTSIQNLGATPTLRPLHGMALHRHSLILPNPCGLDDLVGGGFIEVARHGISAACYQDVFNQITSEGYRPVFVDGYDAGGDLFFNATFRPAGPASVAQHGLTGSEYQDLFDDLTGNGFRLHQIDSYRDGGGVRYAAIFEQRAGPPFAAFHGLTDAEYGDAFDALANDGFVAVNVSTVELGGQLFWTGLFEHVPVNGWTTETVSAANYQATFDNNVAAGRLPIYVHGFSTGAGPYLTGIWVDPMGGGTSAVHGLSAVDYQAAWEANTGAGRLTRAVSGYDDGGGNAVFAAIWRTRPNTAFTSTPPAVTNQTTASFGIAASHPFTTLECRLDAASFAACTSPTSLVNLSEGFHTFDARAVDRELLRDVSPASFTWLVDVTPPVATITTPAFLTKTVHGELKDDPVSMTTVIGWADVVAVVTDNLSGVASVTFKVNGVMVPVGDVVHVPNTDTWSFRFEPNINGEQSYTIEVIAVDGATNSSSDAIQVIGVKTGKPKP
ncbi:MAG TPA: peptidoglycan DD-metalloendopeptidase family protein [Vicinamibacterales bacterium]|nr:peptidoglycan DD-metalloendopeptidase family protein [Vicinamibacterales bacterium]